MACFKCGKSSKGMRLGVDPERGCFVHLCPGCKENEDKVAVLEALRERKES